MNQSQIKTVEVDEVKKQAKSTKKTAVVSAKKQRSKKYKAVRAKVDKTKKYDPFSAVELVKKLSYSKFTGTITAHLVVRDQGLSRAVEFPHSTGKNLKVEIASEKTLKKIEDGNIDFDVLVAEPALMSKITKYAPILGPQGLMPNPKNGTLTPNPKQKKKELESGKLTLKTEREAPLIHVVIGKTDMETKKIVENLKVLISSFKNKLIKLSLAASMSPGVKVEFKETVEA
ncbi:MAG: hypothetical protein U9O78_03255 [Patescibacteria group bacterium]|nr:hypothetical protein [Patescibacteria group bacterium]